MTNDDADQVSRLHSLIRMKKLAIALLFLAATASAQTSDEITFQRTFLLQNVSGTASNPGPAPHHPHIVTRGAWSSFVEGSAFLAYSSESGPEEQRNEIFSTNWIGAGVQRTIGTRGLVLFRGRISLEPYTVPEDGYPQMLQFVTPENGGPLLDAMRPHDLIGEAAVHAAFRTTTASFLHVYAAAVGDPAFGAVPYQQRSSSEEFVEAPFSYDVLETTHDSTRVVTGGFSTRWFSAEASVFHDAVTTGEHTEIDDGDIDSRSARLTVRPTRNLSFQVSQAEVGDDERELQSASLTWGRESGAVSAIWTRRETPTGEELTGGALELTLRYARNTFMARAESVERPSGFLGNPDIEQTAHFTFGYIFDFLRNDGWRTGVGINLDYHTQTHDIEDLYGHKPQAIYLFGRIRTDSRVR